MSKLKKPEKEMVSSFGINKSDAKSWIWHKEILNDIVWLLQKDLKRKGKEASAEDITEILLHYLTDWDETGSPMGYNTKGQLKDTKTGEMIDLIKPNYHLENIQLKTHPSWLYLLCSLYEEYEHANKQKQKDKKLSNVGILMKKDAK